MTLTQLRYLVAIADSRLNITLAAERVHATQPGISKQIRQLEDELGLLLFVRRGRSLQTITAAGARILQRARIVVTESDNIRAEAANQRSEAQGELVVVTTHTQARFVLPHAIAAVRRSWPQVAVQLNPVGDADVLALLSAGHADLALTSTAGAAPDGGLAVPLYRWRRAVLVPRGHALAAQGRAPTLAELAAWPLVSYESSQRPDSSLRLAFARAGAAPQLAITARDADLIKTYVRAGMGVGILAEMALLPEDAGDLVALDAPDALAECTAWAVLPHQRVLRDYVLDLLEVVRPGLDRVDIRRALGGASVVWPTPPRWGDARDALAHRHAGRA